MLMEFGAGGIAQLCAFADLDFVLIDMEHGPFGIREVAELIARFKATEISPIVRVPAGGHAHVARVMDAGAHGVMAPDVRTAAQAQRLNAAMRYAPRRRPAAWGWGRRITTSSPRTPPPTCKRRTPGIC